ncbi:MAG: YARHG domain-containing protein [Myxococcota bacterium]
MTVTGPKHPAPLALGLSVALALACASGEPPAPPAPAPVAAPVPAAIPLYSDTPLVRGDLEQMTLRELSLRRNTIYARAGNRFVKPWLRKYFARQPWYTPRDPVDLSVLTAVDRQNAALIGDVEANLPRRELLARKERLLAAQAEGALRGDDAIELRLVSAALGEWLGDDSVPKARRNPLEDPSVLDRPLKPQQIDELSRRDLRLVRNTIFARYGRPFASPLLADYFSQKAWYHVDPAWDDARAPLTDADRANIDLLTQREDALGGPITDEEQLGEEGGGLMSAA